jgi:hypothetical protein
VYQLAIQLTDSECLLEILMPHEKDENKQAPFLGNLFIYMNILDEKRKDTGK